MATTFSLSRSESEGYVNDAFVNRVLASLQQSRRFTTSYGLFTASDAPREAIVNRCANQVKRYSKEADRKLLWLPPFRAFDMASIGNLSLALLWHIYRCLPPKLVADQKIMYKLGKISVMLPTLTDYINKRGVDHTIEFDRYTTISSNAFPSDKKSSISSIFSACDQITDLTETLCGFGRTIVTEGGFDALVVPVMDMDLCLPEQALALLLAIRTFFCSETITVVTVADRTILSKYYCALHGNALSSKQSTAILMTLFDDWAQLPVPTLHNLVQLLDVPINKEKKTAIVSTVIKSTILTDISEPSTIYRAFSRYSAFINNSSKKFVKNEYTTLALLFCVGACDEALLRALSMQPNLPEIIAMLRGRSSGKSVKAEHAASGNRWGVPFIQEKERQLLYHVCACLDTSVTNEEVAEWIVTVAPFI